MKKYNYISLAILLGVLLFSAAAVYLVPQLVGGDLTDRRTIEVNRACQQFRPEALPATPDISDYPLIKQVEFLSAESAGKELGKFFEAGSDTMFRPVFTDDHPAGYLKFRLIPTDQIYMYRFRWYAALLLAAALILLGALLLYIRVRILKPFVRITTLPDELARGTLTAVIPESGNRYFGKFIWSLNLLKESLEEHRQRELALQKEKKTLLLSLSHDIKTPLSAIKLYLRALRENLYQEPEKLAQIYARIELQADAIEDFTNDIIQTAREDILDIKINPGEFYLSALTERLSSYYRDKLALLKTRFEIVSGEDCLLVGDLDRAVEVFQNLIENAIKYGDGREIIVTSAREEDCLLLTVTNSGNTLPQPEIVHIFDSFYRGSNAAGKRGSGLGLYICRQIMTRMEGDIFAASKDGSLAVTAVLKML